MASDNSLDHIAVIHGPNLNLLGTREPGRYGYKTLAEIDAELVVLAADMSARTRSFQSNSEGDLVTHIQSLRGVADGILINPAAYTHTSVAIRDALLAVDLPTVEIHLSNTHAREAFRHHSTIADIVVGRVMGFGPLSYALGLKGLLDHLRGLELSVVRQSEGD
ncbi:MAG: 3-dehydroquinate dehydratase-2 [Myxococcota bacterium]|jgi:3-dehydroquinate dehydratase-2